LSPGVRPDFFKDIMMVYPPRQVPAPSAAGWLFDLGDQHGPSFVVLRQDEEGARECLSDHLVEIGALPDGITDELLADASVEYAAVIW
jgi:hypothetical protein